MKTNGTQTILAISLLLLFELALTFCCIAQPDYDFRNPVLISGTDKQVGAQYRFSNVRTGVDALVTITAITGGVSLNTLDGGSGYAEAFQPVVTAPAGKNGYIEFKIDFVVTGTSIAMIQTEIPITPIDVDGTSSGGKNLYEYDMISMSPVSYTDYSMTGAELAVSYTSGWVTGKNNAGVDYPGIDTSATTVMFSQINTAVSSVTVRTGVDNQTSSSSDRLRSVYFKRFTYPYSILPLPVAVNFSGTAGQNSVDLQWQLRNQSSLKSIVIEKSAGGAQWQPVADIWVDTQVAGDGLFRYADPLEKETVLYYRLKLQSVNGQITYSKTLRFADEAAASTALQVYPTVVNSSASLRVQASEAGQAFFSIVDYSGRVLYSRMLLVQSGENNLAVDGFDRLLPGHYLAVLRQGGRLLSQKIIKN